MLFLSIPPSSLHPRLLKDIRYSVVQSFAPDAIIKMKCQGPSPPFLENNDFICSFSFLSLRPLGSFVFLFFFSSRQKLIKIAGLQVPRHGGQLDDQAVEVLGHLDLAAEAARLGETKSKVEHVVFVVLGLGHLVVEAFVGDDDVAGRAGAGAAAGALHLEVVGLRNVEEVVALADGNLVLLALLVDERNVEPAGGVQR